MPQQKRNFSTAAVSKVNGKAISSIRYFFWKLS